MFAHLTSKLDMRHEPFLKNLSLMSLVLHEGLEGVSLWLTKCSSLIFFDLICSKTTFWENHIFHLKFILSLCIRNGFLLLVWFRGMSEIKNVSFCLQMFYVNKQCRPWCNAALCCISTWYSLFVKRTHLGAAHTLMLNVVPDN